MRLAATFHPHDPNPRCVPSLFLHYSRNEINADHRRVKDTCKLFPEIFEKRGWNVTTCVDVDCAMEQLGGNRPYEVILLGAAFREQTVCSLSDSSGRLSTWDDGCSYGDWRWRGDEGAGPGAGDDHVLFKPVNPNALVWAVDKHVS